MVDLSCPTCAAPTDPAARFCSSCGGSLRRTCRVCGAEHHASAAFCSACGAALDGAAPRAVPAGGAEERRIATMLFADLAGSTALGERLDPEDVRILQRELYELANREVERFGGVSEKFAGDAVLAVFGVPHAHEDDAERAILAGLALQRSFDGFARRVRERHALDVGLRVGVNTGVVVTGRDSSARGELMVSGDAVNVAARLQQHARPGDVVVGERTARAARGGIRFEALPAVSAKGKSEPVAAWRAVETLAEPRRRGVPGLRAPLIGRDGELGLLEALAARSRAEGTPQLATVFGQAGVGKSRLVSELLERIGGVRVLVGRCLPYGEGVALWALAEVLRSLAVIADTDSEQEALVRLEREAERMPPERRQLFVDAGCLTLGMDPLGETFSGLDPGAVARRLGDAWSAYLAQLSADVPAVLVVEDIHWASAELLDLLEHVAESGEGALLVVCTARPELLETRPLWGAAKQNATALNLSPLSSEDSRRLVGELLHADLLPDAVRSQIVARAEGNPFYLEEMIGMLIDRGALERANGGWRATRQLSELPLPDSVQAVIAARLDLLEPALRDTLRRCAVVGRVFWGEAVGVDADVLGPAVRRGLVRERPRSSLSGMREFSFKHALTRDVAYETLPRAERRRLHLDVATWIERRAAGREGELVELIAHHYLRALSCGETSPAVRDRAGRLLLRAGRAAVGRGALTSARSLLRHAVSLGLPDADHEEADLLIARAELMGGDVGEAIVRLEPMVETRADDGERAELLGWLSRAYWLGGRWDEALAKAEEAVRLLADDPSNPRRAAVLARRAQIASLRAEPEAIEWAREALALARAVGDRLSEVNALITLYTARGQRGEAVDPAEVERASAISVAIANVDEHMRAVVNYLWSGGIDLPLPRLEQLVDEQLARVPRSEASPSFNRYMARSQCLFILLPAGRWSELDARLAAVDLRGMGAPTSDQLLGSALDVGMALRRGELQHVEASLPAALEDVRRTLEPQRIVFVASIAAAHAAVVGDIPAVRAFAGETLAALSTGWTGSLAVEHELPLALIRSGQADLLAELERLARRELYDPTLVRARSLLALLEGGSLLLAGRPREAAVQLEAARDAERERGAAYRATCVDLLLGHALAAAGDADGGERVARPAGELLDALGCVNPF